MKTISKFISLALAVVSPALLLPAAATFAAPISASQACSKLPTLSSQYESTLTTRIATMNTDFAKRLSNIADRSKTTDPAVTAARTKAATAFSQNIARLESLPGLTADQSAAVKTFQTQMTAAEKTRETAVDTARQTYLAALTTIVKDHQSALAAAGTAFGTAVLKAFVTATTDCSNGSAMPTLRSTIKSARTTFTTARQSAKPTGQIKQLAATRNAAIKAANQAFTKAVAEYTATLHTALGVSPSPTPSSTPQTAQ